MAAESRVVSITSGEVVATNVTFEEYLENYAANFCEWEYGDVVKMSPVHVRHDWLTRFLAILLETYFQLRPIGQLRQAPFVMRLPNLEPAREPDLQIILNTNPGTLRDTYMDGPADICIEVISPGSVDLDRGTKFEQYEKGGVGEYWLFDPRRHEALFYRLNDEGVYSPQYPDADGSYTTPRLPGLRLHVPTLWQEQLPGPVDIVQAVQAMLGA